VIEERGKVNVDLLAEDIMGVNGCGQTDICKALKRTQNTDVNHVKITHWTSGPHPFFAWPIRERRDATFFTPNFYPTSLSYIVKKLDDRISPYTCGMGY